jgi:hypothetical protein
MIWLGWTLESETELRRLHARGLSFGTIAKELGATRNSCIGKGRRLGLEARNSPIQIVEVAVSVNGRPIFVTEPIVVAKPPRARPKSSADVVPIHVPLTDTTPPEALPGVGFMQQRDGLCRFPISEETSFELFRACGCPCNIEKPYCAEHTKRASAGRPVPAPRVRQRGGMMPRNHVFAGVAE